MRRRPPARAAGHPRALQATRARCRPPARAAGHPQGVALLYRMGIRAAGRADVSNVFSRATPIGVNLRPPQATRKGWPYYTRRLHKPYDTFVYSRATPCGWPASRSHGLKLTPMRATPCGWPASRSHGLKLTPMRATPCGWPAARWWSGARWPAARWWSGARWPAARW